MINPLGIAMVSTSLVGVGSFAAEVGSTSSPESLIVQGGSMALALGVGLYFIRRSDNRDERVSAEHRAELILERAAHEATRKALNDATAALLELTRKHNGGNP